MSSLSRKLSVLFILLLLSYSSTLFAKKAPSFSLKGNKGTVSLSAHKGQVVYVDFWASWCKPCRKSFPFMNSLNARYGKKGLKVIAINLDTDKAAAKKFLKKNPAKFTIAYDPGNKVSEAYGLRVMPTSFLIDRKGNIVNVHKGFKKKHTKKLEQKIVQALSKR